MRITKNLRMRKRQEAFSPPARGIWTLLSLLESPVCGGGGVKGDRSQQVPCIKQMEAQERVGLGN